MDHSPIHNPKSALVVIGGSKGAGDVLVTIFTRLPEFFPLPIAVVIHRGTVTGGTLVYSMNKYSRLPVIEADDKEPMKSGHIYLAPPNYHLLVEDNHFALSTDEPVHFARPSIDVLFESAADAFLGKTIGVILSGASSDGALGLAAIKEKGGIAIVQDPSTAKSPVMPETAISATDVDRVLSPEEIGVFLIEVQGIRQ